MPKAIIDLRSDTVTRPSPAMREAMANAEVGDDVFGDDPNAARLEARAAEVLGKEAAIFTPTGTLANQIALALHCRPGDDVLCARGAHVKRYESGAAAALAGVQHTELGEGGLFSAEDVVAASVPGEVYMMPRTRLVWVENTHNDAGGVVWPAEAVTSVAAAARELGLGLHLDGARIWNAAVASGREPAELAAPFDTVSACFSKGLGAPAGSVLAGPAAWIGEARRVRKRLGGGMRQVGILCAAALHALEHHYPRLGEDHGNARRLAAGLAELPGLRVDAGAVETNIVVFEVLDEEAGAWVGRARERGVWLVALDSRRVRAVTHLDVGAGDIERALAALAR